MFHHIQLVPEIVNETRLATALVSGDEEAGPSISGDAGGSRLYDVLQVGDDLHDGVDRLVLVPGELFLQTGSDVLTEDVEDQSDDCGCDVFSPDHLRDRLLSQQSFDILNHLLLLDAKLSAPKNTVVVIVMLVTRNCNISLSPG